MIAAGRFKNRSTRSEATRRGSGARGVLSERIEGPQSPGAHQVEAHYDDGHDGERGRQREVAGGALVGKHSLPQEETGIAQGAGNDEVAQGEGEAEDRSRHDAGEG